MTDSIACLRNEGFHVSSAVWFARASELAYEDDAAFIPNWAGHQGFQSAAVFNRGNIQGFQAVAADVALLVFRGTSNTGQLLRDMALLPVGHSWGKVHSGFADGLAQVDEEMTRFAEAARNVPHVWIAGHSLGGALAVLAAAKLRQAGIASTVYTYGQPRVGLGEFAARFESELPGRLWRFINQSDIVARVPPGLLYRHCGQVKRIVRPGQLEMAGNSPVALDDAELPELTDAEFDDVLRELDDIPGQASPELEGRLSLFKDHSILEYIRLLEEINESSSQ